MLPTLRFDNTTFSQTILKRAVTIWFIPACCWGIYLARAHLPEPETGLRRMADAVRPGGWLLVEDLDIGSMLSADVTDPGAIPFIAGTNCSEDQLQHYDTFLNSIWMSEWQSHK
jgi:hypothetical protein